MVLNQIDVAKQRVRCEKDTLEQFQTEVQNMSGEQQEVTAKKEDQLGEEPNALMDDNDDVTKFEERPPGDDCASEFSGGIVQGTEVLICVSYLVSLTFW